ncbi:hypothetical protein [Chitinophaga flava]|uniref:Uncharacterized protein n=1 Tax=Chitinophaga flava TaxID=2259036 RepID=A0A365XWX1_9BACT|nr:hypothetical protein [Chitinophaga flava]RBL90194.1 hypothetical protein DF182_27395 [Chitinophaga flava]
MRILCFYPGKNPGPYISYFIEKKQQDLHLFQSHRNIIQQCPSGRFDLAILECNDQSWRQLRRLRKMTSALRIYQPGCTIMIHRFPSNPDLTLYREIPKALYDFALEGFSENPAPPDLFRMLLAKRKQRLFNKWMITSLKGMIGIGDRINELISNHMKERGIQATIIEVTDDFESLFQDQMPDFVILHCHNRKGDFGIINRATHMIRRIHPDCLIYITCYSNAILHYYETYKLDEYCCDQILTLDADTKLSLFMQQLRQDLALSYLRPAFQS